MQLQFKSTDTIQWLEGFGNRSDGDEVITGSFPNPNTYFNGTSGEYTGVVGSNSGFSIGDIVFIHQTREGGDGAGEWQLNKITDIAGTTFTFRYPLTHNYQATAGSFYAQILKVKQNRDITMSGIVTPVSWDQANRVGGIAVYLAQSFTSGAKIDASDAGYKGGLAVDGGGTVGKRGEGTNGPANTQQVANNGNGGGGGGYSTNGPWDQGNGGGGGSNNTTNGSDGITTGGGNNAGGGGGAQGSAKGNSDLTNIVFGGGGGSGGDKDGTGSTGAGGRGAGIVIIIARSITISHDFFAKGETGQGNVSYHCGAGGAGAGGSILLKGQIINIGTNKLVATGGVRSYRNGSGAGDEDGGSGGDGRIHIDYLVSLTGSTSQPALTSTQDPTLLDPSGPMMALL